MKTIFSLPKAHMRFLVRWGFLVLSLGAMGCAETGENKTTGKPVLNTVTFNEIPSWGLDNHAEALAVFLKSCPPLERRGTRGFADTSVWRRLCNRARNIGRTDASQAKRFFEKHFYPVAVSGPGGSTGLITGYYEPELRGMRQRSKKYNIPLYVRPPDLVTVKLGRFRDDLQGQKIAGRVLKGNLVPYADRETIERGALENQNLELVWVDSAEDAFFLHIQGSGRVRLSDGSTLRVGYAGTNGHPYTAIGRELIARGAVSPEKMSMQAIRTWLSENPADGARLMRTNRSYVFFRELTGNGPVGAQGVALTPERSLAIDRRLLPLGLPVWIDTIKPDGAPFRRLMVAQDTGGAIRGAVRADIFWGAGIKAANHAGNMKSPGRYWFLFPRVSPPAI
ncbi:MAG: MltA domain-containing protein [Pseudomonadota bacterium]|nr:MltA domain-containing protein [Pseudomonadota bacterium]